MLLERLVLTRVGPFEGLDIEFRPGESAETADFHIFVGPNGSGKSTLLYAIAELCQQRGGESLLRPRMRSRSSRVWIKSRGEWAMASPSPVTTPIEAPDGSVLFGRVMQSGLAIHGTDPGIPSFGYSGLRTLVPERLDAIRELGLADVSFAPRFGSQSRPVLKQWIANQFTKRALAQARGDQVAAAARERPVRLLEDALTDVSGAPFTFTLQEDPLDVFAVLNGEPLDLDLLPDGLKSILAWLSDLLLRLDRLGSGNAATPNEREFLLCLDEVEVHLHPAWQRRIVPAVERLFPNAVVFIATHSPFVVASASDAWIYPLALEDGRARLGDVLPSRVGHSYAEVLQEVFGVDADFDPHTEDQLAEFLALRDRKLEGQPVDAELRRKGAELSHRSPELSNIVGHVMRKLAGS